MVARKHLKLRKKAKHPPRGAAAGVQLPSANNLLHAYKREFVEWGSTLGLSPRTAEGRAHGLGVFIAWCDERGITRPQDITRPILQRYQRHLFHYRKRDGDPLAFTTQANMLQPLRAFFKWLTMENHILYNPAADLMIPKIPRQLPKVLLTIEEIEQVLAAPDLGTPTGIRNRAMMETLYSTGLRRSELMRLTLYDIDLTHGTLMVRHGKGGRDRMVPIGARAAAWIGKYLTDVRPLLILEPDQGTLFVTDYGEPFEQNRLSDMVKRYMRQAEVGHGSCHAFRHAMATHMLDAGCDIRYIQAMLGHSQLSTTEIYTQVSIGKLKQIHAATHPARMYENEERDRAANAGAGQANASAVASDLAAQG